MTRFVPAAVERTRRSAVIRRGDEQATAGSGLADNRPEALAQRELAGAVRNGSYVTLQRQRMLGMFGSAPQSRRRSEEAFPGGVTQRQSCCVGNCRFGS